MLARMHFADEVRPLEGVRPAKEAEVEERELAMAVELVERFTGSFDPGAYEDRYRARLLEIVEEKRRGRETRLAVPEEPRATPDLLAALEESLRRHTRGRPARRAGTGRGRRARELTREALREQARELGIRGRSRMTKRELAAAVERASR
ncbi:MAG TPA: Rho termination factor N-terminal domain-containing protein [Gaiellaceae bacterium]|nr:Rho termination factor N-terminal domain-containing protein [Gaiellaceae bacterium]